MLMCRTERDGLFLFEAGEDVMWFTKHRELSFFTFSLSNHVGRHTHINPCIGLLCVWDSQLSSPNLPKKFHTIKMDMSNTKCFPLQQFQSGKMGLGSDDWGLTHRYPVIFEVKMSFIFSPEGGGLRMSTWRLTLETSSFPDCHHNILWVLSEVIA